MFFRICGALLFLYSLSLAQEYNFDYTWDDVTLLDEYVHSDDGYYSWTDLVEYHYNSCSLFVVNMTSQKWQNESFVDRPIWWHVMGIAIPDPENLTYPDAGFMLIDGGSNRINPSPPPEDDFEGQAICLAAVDMGTVGAYIKSVPNQPLVFANDPSQMERSEDSIIAWTWRTYLDYPGTTQEVILRFPMTKAAKRGLDTITNVAQAKAGLDVGRFMVFGASKRGWTTWSLTATDQRIIFSAPMVFSLLNFYTTLQAHFQTMDGAWSFAFQPYYNENLTQEMQNPRTMEIFQYEDMYNFRSRLTLPLLQLVSTGDEFFLCQDPLSWWNSIPDPKWTFMMPNAEHTMYPHYIQIYETYVGFYETILAGKQLPTVSWTMSEDALGGEIVYDTNMVPENVTVFRSVTLRNNTRRDFRLAGLDDAGELVFQPTLWTQRLADVEDVNGDGLQWRARAENVEDEWVAFLIRATYLSDNGKRMFLTSNANIIPGTYPHGPCDSAETCYGYLV